MAEVKRIKTSKKGMPYVEAVLESKESRVTKAFLWRIEHHTQPVGVSLKVGHYWRGGGVEVRETESPRSEVTLTEEQFAALLTFLDENLAALRQGVKQYIVVDNDNAAAVAAKFMTYMSEGDRREVLELIAQHDVLPEDVLAGITARKRQNAISEFGRMLDEDLPEQRWQQWFKANSWVLGSNCVRILGERRIDVDKVADYLVEDYDGHLDVIELKRPDSLFWAPTRDHDNLIPATDLVKAITQAQNYQFELERKIDSIKMANRINRVPIARPRSLLICGRSHEWSRDEFHAQRLLNAGLTGVQVLTYDQVLRRAGRMVEPSEPVAREADDERAHHQQPIADDEDPFGDE